jgi:hypothetical protein
MNPLDFINWYHILVLHLAAILRLLVAYNYVDTKLKAKKENFVWQLYFKDRWDNWLTHYVSMWMLLLVLPPLIELSGDWIPQLKEFKTNPSLNILATGAVGFLGYDAVKWIFNKFKSK